MDTLKNLEEKYCSNVDTSPKAVSGHSFMALPQAMSSSSIYHCVASETDLRIAGISTTIKEVIFTCRGKANLCLITVNT